MKPIPIPHVSLTVRACIEGAPLVPLMDWTTTRGGNGIATEMYCIHRRQCLHHYRGACYVQHFCTTTGKCLSKLFFKPWVCVCSLLKSLIYLLFSQTIFSILRGSNMAFFPEYFFALLTILVFEHYLFNKSVFRGCITYFKSLNNFTTHLTYIL